MGKEMNILSRENFVTFQFDFQHTGPQFRYLICSLAEQRFKKLPRNLKRSCVLFPNCASSVFPMISGLGLYKEEGQVQGEEQLYPRLLSSMCNPVKSQRHIALQNYEI
jgi:hypothetical protein